MDKINFQNDIIPLNDTNLNKMQDNMEKAIEQKHAYSIEEQVIGTWKDGKPIYRRGFYLDSLNHEYKAIGTIENIKKLIGSKVCFTNSSGIMITLPNICYSSDNKIEIQSNSLIGATDIDCFVEYTKTTDK